jgi:hypothetical protein
MARKMDRLIDQWIESPGAGVCHKKDLGNNRRMLSVSMTWRKSYKGRIHNSSCH